jgi:hypothetical protein
MRRFPLACRTHVRRRWAVVLGVLALLLLSVGIASALVPPAFVTTWGTAGSGNGQLLSPWGIAVDGSGNVYVADSNPIPSPSNDRIQKFTGSGGFLTTWGTSGSAPGQFKRPRGIAVDASGCVYVTDTNNHRIQKFCYLAPPKPPSLDHFQCYVPKKTPPHVLGVASLQDEFDGKKFEQVKITALYRFCNAVRKVFSGKVTPIAQSNCTWRSTRSPRSRRATTTS